MLILEIEFLTGVCYTALPEEHPGEEPDWPPQPDRVFSALVCAWATRGSQPEEKSALEWLEQQPAPSIQASDYCKRLVGVSFVPTCDDRGRVEVLPMHRGRQPRMFPAAIPHVPALRFLWPSDPTKQVLSDLQALARDTAYIGHSASVVRCRFLLGSSVDNQSAISHPRRRVYPGRLAELEQCFLAGVRPGVGALVAESPRTFAAEPQSVFSEQWIVFEDAGGACPDLRGATAVARRFREALMSRYGAAGIPVPKVVSGHEADGAPASSPHLAILPLADVGNEYSTGRLMGIALVLPRDSHEARLKAERDWLAGLEGGHKAAEWHTFDRLLGQIEKLELGALGVWEISRTLVLSKQSLRPGRYTLAARRWSSVTPVVLDRYPKAKTAAEREDEICSIIASSCTNIQLPMPRKEKILFHKHAALRGSPSAYPSGRSPQWMRWTLPGFLQDRVLTHVTIEFDEPVRGPLLLGAGRYVGLGLCMGVQG